jgi:hypothetical protein
MPHQCGVDFKWFSPNFACLSRVGMNLFATCRSTLQRFCAAVLSLVAMFALASTAKASCGDYLLHGTAADHNSANNHWLATEDSSAPSTLVPYSIFRAPSNDPLKPKSSCEGGRCQSQPIPAPVDHSRISIPRQPALLTFLQSLRGESGNETWPRPSNGLAVDSPFSSVPSPPPRPSFTVA